MSPPSNNIMEEHLRRLETMGLSYPTPTLEHFDTIARNPEKSISPDLERITIAKDDAEPKLLPAFQPTHRQRKSSLSNISIQPLNIRKSQAKMGNDATTTPSALDFGRDPLTPTAIYGDPTGVRYLPSPREVQSPSHHHRRGSSFASQNFSDVGPDTPNSGKASTQGRMADHSRSSSHVSDVSVPSLSHSVRISDFQSTKELEKIRRKHNCVRELYNTECQFAQDMAVIVRIYMCGSAEVDLSMRQIGTLFSNVAQVLDVSLSAVAIMESKIPQQILKGDGAISTLDLAADETLNIGRAMCLILTGQLYEVYECYIHGSRKQMELYYEITKVLNQHSQGNSLSSSPSSKDAGLNVTNAKLSAWMNRCRERVCKFTTAWSLESLLIKPIQRLGKYPLFLKSLLDCTDPNHPDYADLERAYCRSKQYLECVNTRFGNDDR